MPRPSATNSPRSSQTKSDPRGAAERAVRDDHSRSPCPAASPCCGCATAAGPTPPRAPRANRAARGLTRIGSARTTAACAHSRTRSRGRANRRPCTARTPASRTARPSRASAAASAPSAAPAAGRVLIAVETLPKTSALAWCPWHTATIMPLRTLAELAQLRIAAKTSSAIVIYSRHAAPRAVTGSGRQQGYAVVPPAPPAAPWVRLPRMAWLLVTVLPQAQAAALATSAHQLLLAM